MMQYTVYKTVNSINGKFYVGVHKTDNPNDEYLGSGKLIKQAVTKYGEQNFHKEVLAVFDNSTEAFELEKRLVAEALNSPLCYNLKAGGEGGFDWVNKEGLVDHSRCGRAMNDAIRKRLDGDPVYALRWMKIQNQKVQRMQQRANEPEVKRKAAAGRRKVWVGKHHTKKAKALIAAKARLRRGNLNSQFGTRWITNGIKDAKISKDQPIPKGWQLGRS